MNYVTPEEVLTYLPKEVRESESKADLISYIIRGYRRLKIPQDKDVREKIIQIDTTNYAIPDNFKSIYSVEYVNIGDCGGEDCYEMATIYPTETTSDLCSDINRCNDCELKYSIIGRTLRLPVVGTYRIVYYQLFSDELLIFGDETLIDYLAAFATYQVTYNRSRRSDVTQNMLQFDYNLMNSLYTSARGAVIMRAIKLQNHKLNTKIINLSYDEFNN